MQRLRFFMDLSGNKDLLDRELVAFFASRKATPHDTQLARAMGDAQLFIKQRHIRNCHRADPTYGEGVAKALGLSLSEALIAEDPAHPKWDWR